MSKDFIASLVMIVFVVLGAILLFAEIYKIKKQTKLIIKMNRNTVSLLIWLLLLITWVFIFISNIINGYKDLFREIFMPVLWILIASFNTLQSYRGSEIREDGIYHQRNFFSWDSLKGYSWISPVELRLHTNGKYNRKIVVKRELKSKIDEVLKQYLNEFTYK